MTGRRLPRLMYWHPTLKHRPVFERGDQMTDNPCCAHFADTGTHSAFCRDQIAREREALGPPASGIWWVGRPTTERDLKSE